MNMGHFGRLALSWILFLSVAACTKKSPSETQTINNLPSHESLVGGYKLPKEMLSSCPFTRETFSFDGLLRSIETQLKSKVDGVEKCASEKKSLYDNLNAIQLFYSNLDNTLGTPEGAEIYQNFVNDLQAQYEDLKAHGQENSSHAAMIRSTIMTVQSSMVTLNATAAMQKSQSEQVKKLQSQKALFEYVNSVFFSLSNMDAQCVNSLGGWKQVLTPVLGAAALASGYSVFGSQALAGSVLQIASSISYLFENRAAKEALVDITQSTNRKVLACTYFSIQHMTCEIRRGIRMANEHKDTLVNRLRPDRVYPLVDNKPAPLEWAQFLDLRSKLPTFSFIFNSIAIEGSSLTLDLDLVIQYFAALRIRPDDLLTSEPPLSASTTEKSAWIRKAQSLGVHIPERDNNNIIIPLDKRVEIAHLDLVGKVQLIELVESTLKENKSFDALKDKLTSSPDLLKNTEDTEAFLLEQADLLPEMEKAAVEISAQMMTKIREFMQVKFVKVPGSTNEGNIERYMKELVKKGSEVFAEISRGSVAQLRKQEILALGPKAEERLEYAFKAIENRLVKKDLDEKTAFENTFIYFKANDQLFYDLSQIYTDLQGTGAIFRDDDVDVAFKSYEKGFREELLALVAHQLSLKSEIAPELKEATAPHMCAMFADFLQRDSSMKARSLLKECKKRFTQLEIKTLTEPSSETIEWDNSCFYPDFIRKDRTHKVLDHARRTWKK